MTDRVEIQGMGCEHCVTAVREALEEVEGVEIEAVEIGSARVRADGARKQDIDEAIRKAGYEPVSHTEAA